MSNDNVIELFPQSQETEFVSIYSLIRKAAESRDMAEGELDELFDDIRGSLGEYGGLLSDDPISFNVSNQAMLDAEVMGKELLAQINPMIHKMLATAVTYACLARSFRVLLEKER